MKPRQIHSFHCVFILETIFEKMGQGITLFWINIRELPKSMGTSYKQPTSDISNSGIWIHILSL